MLLVLQLTYQQFQNINSYKINDEQLVIINIAIPEACDTEVIKTYKLPFVLKVDNFTLNYFQGNFSENTSLAALTGHLSGCQDKFNKVTLQVEIPSDSKMYLQIGTASSHCVNQCQNAATSATNCQEFNITNITSAAKINSFFSPVYNIFSYEQETLIQAIQLQFIIEMKNGVFQVPSSVKCFGDNVENNVILTEKITVDNRVHCPLSCLQMGNSSIQGSVLENINQVFDLQYLFVWRGTDSLGKQFRSETQSWYFYSGIQRTNGQFTAISNWFKKNF